MLNVRIMSVLSSILMLLFPRTDKNHIINNKIYENIMYTTFLLKQALFHFITRVSYSLSDFNKP